MSWLLDFMASWCNSLGLLLRRCSRPALDVREESTWVIVTQIMAERHGRRAVALLERNCDFESVRSLVLQDYKDEVRTMSLKGDSPDNAHREMYIADGIRSIIKMMVNTKELLYHEDVDVPEEPDAEEEAELQRRLDDIRLPVNRDGSARTIFPAGERSAAAEPTTTPKIEEADTVAAHE